MTEVLIFLLGPSAASPIRWASASGGLIHDSGVLTDAGGLVEVAERARGAQSVIALLPGEQVACRRMPALPRGVRKRRAAAELLLEDELAEPRAGLEIGVAEADGSAVAFAARSEIIRGWLQAFSKAGIACDCLSADYLALPSSMTEATIVVDGGRVVVAFAGLGLALEADLFARLAGELFAEPPALYRVIGEESDVGDLLKGGAVDWLGPASGARILEAYGASASDNAVPNLLRRPLINRKAIAATLGPWRRAGALAASLAVLGVCAVIADGAKASLEADRWTSAAQQVHARSFPDAAGQDPVEFARRRLAGGAGGASFRMLSSRLQSAADGESSLSIDRIRFDGPRGEFVASVRSDNDAAVEAFKVRLGEAGLTVEDSGGFRKSGEAWVGDIKATLK